jgi:uncharacterized FlaG/YvyC family protein
MAKRQAKSEISLTGGTVVSKRNETLPCRLSTEELLDWGQKLASLEADIRAQLEHADSVKKQLKADEQRLKSEMTFVSSVVKAKAEPRAVEVQCELDENSRTRVLEVRTDTGEVIRKRPARSDELQPELPIAVNDEQAQSEE